MPFGIVAFCHTRSFIPALFESTNRKDGTTMVQRKGGGTVNKTKINIESSEIENEKKESYVFPFQSICHT